MDKRTKYYTLIVKSEALFVNLYKTSHIYYFRKRNITTFAADFNPMGLEKASIRYRSPPGKTRLY